MSYNCPRCGNPVQRVSANRYGFLFDMLLHPVSLTFQCKQCGVLNLDEFPPDVRKRMKIASFLGGCGMALIVLLALCAAIAYGLFLR